MPFLEFARSYPMSVAGVAIAFIVFLFFPLVVITLLVAAIIYDKVNSKSNDDVVEVNEYYVPAGRCNQFMSQAQKAKYLQSPEWKELRKQVLARDIN